jgi:hypothetical protein
VRPKIHLQNRVTPCRWPDMHWNLNLENVKRHIFNPWFLQLRVHFWRTLRILFCAEYKIVTCQMSIFSFRSLHFLHSLLLTPRIHQSDCESYLLEPIVYRFNVYSLHLHKLLLWDSLEYYIFLFLFFIRFFDTVFMNFVFLLWVFVIFSRNTEIM